MKLDLIKQKLLEEGKFKIGDLNILELKKELEQEGYFTEEGFYFTDRDFLILNYVKNEQGIFYVDSRHIDLIDNGNIVYHDGDIRTVCAKDIKKGDFMGTSLFGDSYSLGTKKVRVIIFKEINK